MRDGSFAAILARSRRHQLPRSSGGGGGGSSTTTTTSGGGASFSPFHSRNRPQSPQKAAATSLWLPHMVHTITR
ncbi:hypothetical protein BJP25_20090 [Actinokineospora bangkokensis]|uniref:Uncharacterized protein n=1 Tax=Actinokineospora bangkokensis TaxID=1193682 RepID=A0A1Q9LK46_9PSEU|nr:hypothetical protein BJP25_20090 [Actinokineospora bangkokensis]